MPQDHQCAISDASMSAPSSLSWATVKLPKQNASMVSTLFGIYFAGFLAKYRVSQTGTEGKILCTVHKLSAYQKTQYIESPI